MLEYLDTHFGTVLCWLVAISWSASGCGVTIYGWRRERNFTKSALAEVIRLEERDFDGSTTYRSWVRFEVDGQSYQIADSIATTPPCHSVGQRLVVYYPPDNPQLAVIGRWRGIIPYAMLGIVGGTLLVVLIVKSMFW